MRKKGWGRRWWLGKWKGIRMEEGKRRALRPVVDNEVG